MNSTGVEITAGLGGFLVLFGLALALWFLGRDLTRRLRRMRAAEDRRVERERQARTASTEQAVSARARPVEQGGPGEQRGTPAAEDAEGDPLA